MDSEIPSPLPEETGPPAREPLSVVGGPWGFWATMGLGAVIGLAGIIAQTVGAVAWIFISGLPTGRGAGLLEELMHNGGVIAYGTLFGGVVGVTLCVVIARLR